MKDRNYLLSLSVCPGFGPVRIGLLLSYFSTAEKAWKADAKELLTLGLGEKRTETFINFRKNFNLENYLARLKSKQIEFITILDEKYPVNLKGLSDAPPVLYIKGGLTANDENAVAVVGSRKMTSYGREVTEKFAGELSVFGLTIISGLARGVDTAAHKSALAAGGRTIAILGCGLDMVYPPENFKLAEEIAKNGAVISEYPLGTPAIPTNFASRNRIVSGLSKAVLVVEGAEKSGTLLTASHAAEQGKTVFAVPGQINSPMSGAPMFLLKNGAKMAISPRDILDELDIQVKVDREKMERVMPSPPEEGYLLEILANEPLHLDEVARISSTRVAEISARLTVMEIKGMVRSLGGGVYRKV